MSSISPSSARKSVLAPLIGIAAFGLLLGACKSTPPDPVNLESTQEVSATVQSIDVERRLLSLRDDTGEQVTVEVSPAVRNLDQVKPGDKVVARYYESLAAELVARGDGSGSTQAPVKDAVIGRAAPGAKPGVVMGTENRQTVRITKVDKKNNVVSFFGSDGLARSLPIKTPEGREFIGKLKEGDEVEVRYTEAVAVTVEPVKTATSPTP
jgi:hypothetical protein